MQEVIYLWMCTITLLLTFVEAFPMQSVPSAAPTEHQYHHHHHHYEDHTQ